MSLALRAQSHTAAAGSARGAGTYPVNLVGQLHCMGSVVPVKRWCLGQQGVERSGASSEATQHPCVDIKLLLPGQVHCPDRQVWQNIRTQPQQMCATGCLVPQNQAAHQPRESCAAAPYTRAAWGASPAGTACGPHLLAEAQQGHAAVDGSAYLASAGCRPCLLGNALWEC